MRLKGKLALVTGASRGIGFAVAELFAREGTALARLVVTEIKRHQRYLKHVFNGYGAKQGVSSAGMPSCIDTSACCRLHRESRK